MSIHEHLPPQARKQLKEVGWTKGLESAKLARRDKQHFDCATWLHKAAQLPKEEFKQEVEKELTGKETEPWEIVYFKLYKSQMPVIDRAIETAALMLGSDRSRGYCLEMICADFLAGANLDHGDPEMLLFSMKRFFKFLPEEQRRAFLWAWQEAFMSSIDAKSRGATEPTSTRVCVGRYCVETVAVSVVWNDVEPRGSPPANFEVTQVVTSRKNLMTSRDLSWSDAFVN